MIKEYTAILDRERTKRYVFAVDEQQALEELKELLEHEFFGYDKVEVKDNKVIATGSNTIFDGEDVWTVEEVE